nr:auxin-responsive protein SAUR71 [Ipomoea batatas]GME02839.1 auxin-responsive protein SAUR71 [Ipomoea batatas]
MKKINLLLRKCKSLSRQLARTSSYSSLRSRSTRDEDMLAGDDDEQLKCEVVLFDHLLWMLENAYDEDDDGSLFSSAESLEELADLYVV